MACQRASALSLALLLSLVMPFLSNGAEGYGERVFNANLATSNNKYDVDSNQLVAQSFTPSKSFRAFNLTLYVENVGSSQADVLSLTVQTDNAGEPSGTAVSSGNGVISGLGWLNAPLSPSPTLAGGATYWIVASSTEAMGEGYTWFFSSGDQAPGQAKVKSGMTWTSVADRDMTYLTYGILVEPCILVALTVDPKNVEPGQTIAYTVYMNNTGSLEPTLVWLNLSLPQDASYVSDTAAGLGGTRVSDYNWTFPPLSNNPHSFTVTALVDSATELGSMMKAVALLGHTNSSGIPQPPSTSQAIGYVGLVWKQNYLVHDGVKDLFDGLQAARPDGVIEDFDGDGNPGLTLKVGSSNVNAAHWTLAPPLARDFRVVGQLWAVLYLDSVVSSDKVNLNVTFLDRGGVDRRIAWTSVELTFNGASDWEAFIIDLGSVDHLISAGNVTELLVFNEAGGDSLISYNSSTLPSRLVMTTCTYISIAGFSLEDAHGPASFFSTMDTVHIDALVTDPFGSGEIAETRIDVWDPDGVQIVINARMTLILTDPATPSRWKVFRQTLSSPAKQGRYDFNITAIEGNGVTDHASGSFIVRVPVISLDIEPDSTYSPSGTQVTATVHLNNTGLGNGTAWVNVSLSPGVSYVSDTSGPSGGIKTGNHNWTFLSVPPGPRSFDLTVLISPGIPPPALLYVQGDMSYADEKGFVWTSSPSAMDIAVIGPNVVADLDALPSAVHRGEIVNLTVGFDNVGTQTSTRAWVNVTLPPALSYSSDTAPSLPQFVSRDVSGNPLRYVFSNVLVAPHQFSVDTLGSSSILPLDTIIVSTTVDYTTATGVVRSNATLNLQGAGPSLSIDVIGPTGAVPQDAVPLTLYYNNTGLEEARNVLVSISLDPVTVYSASVPSPSSVAGGHLEWTFASVAVGPHSISIQVILSAGLADGFVATIAANADYEDALGNQFSAPPDGHVLRATVPVISFSAGANAVAVEGGDVVQFTLLFPNSGSGVAGKVWVNVTLPATLILLNDDSPVQETVSAGLRSWLYLDLPPGQHALHLNTSVAYSAIDGDGLVANTTIRATDANGAFVCSDSRDVALTVTTARVTVALVSVPDNAEVSRTFAYTLLVNNTGGRAAAHIWVNQTLDVRLQFVGDDSNLPRIQQGSLVSWHVTNLAPAESLAFSVTLRVFNGSDGDLLTLSAQADYTGSGAVPIGFHRTPEVVTRLSAPVAGEGFPWAFIVLAAFIGAVAVLLYLWQSRRSRIEEVFLLHKEGTLLYHVSRTLGGVGEKDKDILASMLTAVQDFVKESFMYGEKRELKQLEFGDYRVLMERGKHIFIAVVYSGASEGEVRRLTKRAVDEVEEKYGKALEDWGGHMNRVIGARDIVRRTLLRM